MRLNWRVPERSRSMGHHRDSMHNVEDA